MKTKILLLFAASALMVLAACNQQKKADPVTPTHTHSYKCTETLAPTCVSEGVESCVCETCGDIELNVLEKLPHISSGCVPYKYPTCIEPGIDVCECEVCGADFESQVPALGHDFEDGRCKRCSAYENQPMVVDVGALVVRAEPTRQSSQVGELTYGKTVTVLEIEENGEDVNGVTRWVKTVLINDHGNKTYGWVSTKYLVTPEG